MTGNPQWATEIVFVPAEALQLVGIRTPDDVIGTLGVRLGVPVSTVDEIQDVLFASLSGRMVPFDTGSFDR